MAEEIEEIMEEDTVVKLKDFPDSFYKGLSRVVDEAIVAYHVKKNSEQFMYPDIYVDFNMNIDTGTLIISAWLEGKGIWDLFDEGQEDRCLSWCKHTAEYLKKYLLPNELILSAAEYLRQRQDWAPKRWGNYFESTTESTGWYTGLYLTKRREILLPDEFFT